MTDTNQLPPLPDFLSDTNSINAFVESTDEQIRDAFRAYALQAIAQVRPAQAEVTDEKILKTLRPDVWMHVEGLYREQMLADARAILALRSAAVPMTPLTDAQMEKGRDQIFSINNPYCPCDRKTFKKVAQWVERHHQFGITAQAKNEDA